jgi:acyl-CoA thioesterase-1
MRTAVVAALSIGTSAFIGTAHATSIHIVALGASNTNGKGVGSENAWPSVLQRLLQARGYDVTVTVNAMNGRTSSTILGLVDSAVTPGTQVVIFDIGMANDRKVGVSPAETRAHKAEIEARIRAHGARPIFAPYEGCARQPDGRHLSVGGHAQVAARLVPSVIAGAKRGD